MGTTEIVQAITLPVEKLINTVSNAIGKMYEPRNIRKKAEAKANEIEIISEVIRNNRDIPIVYNSEGVSIDAGNYEEIAKRTSSCIAYQEISKQQNIESVVDSAYDELEKIENVSSEAVNHDWVSRFFNSVEDISDEYMQKIWGRILAGEIKSPNSYSYRTLEKLRNMSQQEAQYFQLVSSLSLKDKDNNNHNRRFILAYDELIMKYGVNFEFILTLEECGLIKSQNLSLTFEVSDEQTGIIYNSRIIGIFKGKEKNLTKVDIPIYIFTESGKQLINVIYPETNSQYILDCLHVISKSHYDVTITAHHISSIDDKGNINYNTRNILLLDSI